MGLIQAIKGAAGGVMADQWREYFYCDSLPIDILVTKGRKRTSDKRSSNSKAEDNIISNGSIVAVNDGQVMMIVEQGLIVEVCAEPGEFVYDTSTEPTLLFGNFGENLGKTFSTLGKRFTFGGDTAKDQRVYYFNAKEILDNLFGSGNPIPFRVVYENLGLDLEIGIRCHGQYSYRIVNPLLFYKNVCGNVSSDYTRDQIDKQLKSEMLSALQPAFARISAKGYRYTELLGETEAIAVEMRDILSPKWSELRGIEMVSFAINSLTASEEDEAMIKKVQETAVYSNANMAAAKLVSAQANAMEAAASNTSTGPMMAFAGMNMAGMAGGMNANSLFEMGAAQKAQQAQQAPVQPAPAPAPAAPAPQQAVNGWTCPCGTAGNTGKFCMECGARKPEDAGWTCACGSVNQGKFCMECGARKPAGAPLYKCDKCGWEPEDPMNPPRFCPECGDTFDENDIKN